MVRTWDVVAWADRPERTQWIGFVCPSCGNEAELEVGADPGAAVVATIGLGVVFDPSGHTPPDNFMPDEVRCRKCRRIFSSEPEASHVR